MESLLCIGYLIYVISLKSQNSLRWVSYCHSEHEKYSVNIHNLFKVIKQGAELGFVLSCV